MTSLLRRRSRTTPRSGGPQLADELEKTGYAWVQGARPEVAPGAQAAAAQGAVRP